MADAAAERHIVYLDEARTHEVHAQLASRPGAARLRTTELPAGSRDPADAVVADASFAALSEARAAVGELEERLSCTGTYYRADAADMKWALLAQPAVARRVDLRAHEVAMPGAPTPDAKMAFHHFHADEAGRDALLITMPRFDLGASRAILAQLDFDFPDVDGGEMRVVHPRLAPATLRSSLVREHVALPKRGFAKLVEPRDYERAFGAGWLERARDVLRGATRRVVDAGRTGNLAAATPPSVFDERAIRDALRSERVARLRHRFLRGRDPERILQGGDLAIRRFVQTLRRRGDHAVAYDLAVLEASLLVEYGLLRGIGELTAEAGPKVVRYAQARL